MSGSLPHSVQQVMSLIEENWKNQAILFEQLESEGGWDGRHGADWTFADVPFHLAYCNEEIAFGLKAGPDYPGDRLKHLQTPEEISAWNKQKFADRPAEQTAWESVQQLYASWEAIRKVTSSMSDEDLGRKSFWPVFTGWATALDLLHFVVTHDWTEMMQLRIHMGLDEPAPSPANTNIYLDRMFSFFPFFLNKEAARGMDFSVMYAFTDDGIHSWVLRVRDGEAVLEQGSMESPDLLLTQSYVTFEKTFRGILDPAEAIQSGDFQVSSFEALETFGNLFPIG